MNARRVLAISLLSLGLFTACVPGELGELFDFAVDWADSDDPGLRAASRAAEEVVLDDLARQSFEQGFDTVDASAFDQAATLRPTEPRYPTYAGVVHAANGEFDEAHRANQRAVDALKAQFPEASSQEIGRRLLELHLEATRDLFVNGGSTHLDQELRVRYCAGLSSYLTLYGDSVDGAFYLATADYSPCD